VSFRGEGVYKNVGWYRSTCVAINDEQISDQQQCSKWTCVIFKSKLDGVTYSGGSSFGVESSSANSVPITAALWTPQLIVAGAGDAELNCRLVKGLWRLGRERRLPLVVALKGCLTSLD
jgi:hypothetical protein